MPPEPNKTDQKNTLHPLFLRASPHFFNENEMAATWRFF